MGKRVSSTKRLIGSTIRRIPGGQALLRLRHAGAMQAELEHALRDARVQRRYARQEHRRANAEAKRADLAERSARVQRRQANEYEALSRTVKLLPRHRYGSLTSGVDEWAKKWDSSPGRRILLFAKRDYSGSFYKWAAAINEFTPYAARLVTTAPHQYGYPLDLLIPNPKLIDSNWRELWAEADVLHLKDETGFMNGSNQLPPEMLSGFAGPVVFTQYGGYARKHRDDPEYQSFVLGLDSVVSMTPDLCFEWLGDKPTYIPHSIDTAAFPHAWTDKLVVGHSPSTRARKGTTEFLAAAEQLVLETPVELELIEGVSHAEAIRRKRETGIFFDQAGREVESTLGINSIIGWYGNSALEAAVYGVPTIAHLSEYALGGAVRSGSLVPDSIPFLNTQLGTEGILETLRTYFDMSSGERKALSLRTRRFIEDFHSQEAVGQRLAQLYDPLV